MSIFKMMRVDGHDYVDLSWKLTEGVIEVEAAKTELEIQQRLIDMGWTPPVEEVGECLHTFEVRDL